MSRAQREPPANPPRGAGGPTDRRSCPHELPDVCPRLIIGFSRVVYHVFGKPPATIERE